MSTPSNPLFATFVTMLIDTLIAMVPGSDDDTKETRRGIARLMFEAYEPRDAIEAMAAARAVAAHHAAMDNFTPRRAARRQRRDRGALAVQRARGRTFGRGDAACPRQAPTATDACRGEHAGAAAGRQPRDAAPARHTAGPGAALTAAGLSRQHRTFHDAAAGAAGCIVAVTA